MIAVGTVMISPSHRIVPRLEAHFTEISVHHNNITTPAVNA